MCPPAFPFGILKISMINAISAMYFNFILPMNNVLTEKLGTYVAEANKIANTDADAPIAIELTLILSKTGRKLKDNM